MLGRADTINMRKRIRKTRHRGEFRQLGFSVDCRLQPGLSLIQFDQFIDDFIGQAVEAQGLVFGGGGSADGGWGGVICRDHRYESTAERGRDAVQKWLQPRSEVASFRLSGFWDVWHGPDPFDPKLAPNHAARPVS